MPFATTAAQMASMRWASPLPVYPRSRALLLPALSHTAFPSRAASRESLHGSSLRVKARDGWPSVKAQQTQTLEPGVNIELEEQLKLVQDVKIKLESLHPGLPVGKNGRDDDDVLLWFLKDRKYDTDAAVGKLVKALTWRRDFGVDNLTEESIKGIAATGKAYLHSSPDIQGRPVVVVVAANHFPARDDIIESERLCVYLIEKALSQLPAGKDRILGIFDLRGFTSQNGDFKFVKFLVDAFFNYYPKRLDQVLFVEAPFIFKPGWHIVKPWLKSYSSLVRFCTAEAVQQEYFTPDSVPPDFRIPQML